MRSITSDEDMRETLLAIFHAGIAAVQAEQCLPTHLPKDRPAGRTVLFALGKAAGYMAKSALDHVHVDSALIITRHGHMPPGWTPPATAQVIEAGHPNPDAASLLAGEAAIDMAKALGQGDRLIALISGGGSALMAAPIDGISFAEKQKINRALLASGAPIADMNRVRAAMSQVKGGRLAELASGAEILTYVISDIPGDDPAFVASGPTIPLPDGEDATELLSRYGIAVAPHVARLMAHKRVDLESPQAIVVAKASQALAAMAEVAHAAGYQPVILGDDIEGDAEQVARQHARLALDYQTAGKRIALISGGETSVNLSTDPGTGGRNLTYALALAIELKGAAGICALAADSDGIDGTSHAAGAIILPSTLARAQAVGKCAETSLSAQNSFSFFDQLGLTILTDPTGTNVNDLRVLLIDNRQS